jgi:hypothetical protein
MLFSSWITVWKSANKPPPANQSGRLRAAFSL